MLDYDNSAFYYFSITLLLFYVIPGSWYALSEIYHAFIGSGEIGSKARTHSEKEKADKLRKGSTGFVRLRKYPFIINLVCLAIAIPLFFYLVSLVMQNGQVSQFDPYTILGIETQAKMAEIKKAYRKLSLQYHPDKNIGNKKAEEMFMKVAKAYEALTDETSKENYEKYGNPDGKQSLEVSIGLPKFILEHPKLILVLYLIGMVVIIPVVVGLWYANSKQFGEKNIKYETYTAFYQLLQEGNREKQLPEVLAASAECRELNATKPGDAEPIGLLYGKMKNEKLMQKPKYEHPIVLRGNLLLHAHVLRLTETLTPELRTDLDKMLAKTPELIEGMIEIAYQRKWLETTFAAIRFSQFMVQGLWSSGNPLMQLPHFTADEAKSATKSAKGPPKTFGDFLRLPDADKKLPTRFSEDEKAEVLSACKLFPINKVDLKLFVEEEEKDFLDDEPLPATPAPEISNAPQGDKIFEQDLVTLRVTITRTNVEEGKNVSPVYAPLFPKTIHEGLWVILTDKPQTDRKPVPETLIHAVEKITEYSRQIVHEVRFMAPPRAGHYNMTLHVLSDCYIGLDEKIDFDFDVAPATELPEYVPHPEDVELDNEPTLFEQVMAANMDDSSDDEDDDDKPKKIAAAAGSGDEGQTTEDQGESDED